MQYRAVMLVVDPSSGREPHDLVVDLHQGKGVLLAGQRAQLAVRRQVTVELGMARCGTGCRQRHSPYPSPHRFTVTHDVVNFTVIWCSGH